MRRSRAGVEIYAIFTCLFYPTWQWGSPDVQAIAGLALIGVGLGGVVLAVALVTLRAVSLAAPELYGLSRDGRAALNTTIKCEVGLMRFDHVHAQLGGLVVLAAAAILVGYGISRLAGLF